jgi:hypothetical protein
VKQVIRYFFALHVSLAYLGMLTGLGMLLFSFLFFYLFLDGAGLSVMFRWPLAYVMFILGPGALALAAWFYSRMKRQTDYPSL